MESSFFSSKKPHFFKVLTEDVMSFEKLPLPPAFVLKHGRSLSNSVSLRVPNGVVWPVRLLKQDGNNICFHIGWRNFAKFYSLCYGYLIAFELEESNKFSVLIFNTITREINYPHTSSEEPEHSIDVSDELSDELTRNPMPRKNLTSQHPCSSKKVGAHSTSKTKSKKALIPPFKRSESDTESDMRIARHGSALRGKKMESVAKPKASERATKSNGTSNLHCKAKISALDQTTNKIISSRGSKEPTHQATKPSSVQPKKKTRKGRYWEISKAVTVWNPLKAKEKSKALMAANEFISDNPHFKVVIRQSYLKYNLLVRSKFADKYIKDTVSNAILSVDGKKTTWSVEVRKYYSQSAGCIITKISHDWPKFVRDNKLKIGDVCVFELTNRSKVKFKVSIFRAASGRKSVVRIPSHGSVLKGKNMEVVAKPKASEKANGNGASILQIKAEGEEAEADLTTPRFNSVAKKHQSALTNAHFKVTIQTSYISQRQVQIPAQFAKTHLQGINHCNVTLCLSGSNGKSWSAEYHCEGTGEQEKRILYHGWHKFFCDNLLNLGDVCRFEWMDAAEVKLKVSISRVHGDRQGVSCKLET